MLEIGIARETYSSTVILNEEMADPDPTRQAVLHRLADTLDIPVERFFTDRPHLEGAASADECLRLWFSIATEDGRQQALEALKAIAASEEYSQRRAGL